MTAHDSIKPRPLNWFPSLKDADRYFRPYGRYLIDVAGMVSRGEINIGGPPEVEGVQLVLVNENEHIKAARGEAWRYWATPRS